MNKEKGEWVATVKGSDKPSKDDQMILDKLADACIITGAKWNKKEPYNRIVSDESLRAFKLGRKQAKQELTKKIEGLEKKLKSWVNTFYEYSYNDKDAEIYNEFKPLREIIEDIEKLKKE